MEGQPVTAIPVGFNHREILIIVTGVMLCMALAALDQTIVATALPAMARELQGIEHMSWVVSGYLLTSTAATPIYGKLSDLYGRKRMLHIALGIFLAASVLCALSETMGQLILFRALQGAGGGGLAAVGQAAIADVVAPRERGRYNGYFTAVYSAASVAGPVLGGLFADHLSWRWVFWINLPFGLAAIIVTEKALRKLTAKSAVREIDYWGAALLTAAVTELLLVTTWGGVEMPWASPLIIGLVLTSLALIVVFILRERFAREPILPLRLFRIGIFRVATLVTSLNAMVMFGAIVFLPLFLQLVTGDTASASGLLLIPLTVSISAGAFTSGRVVTSTGRYKVLPCIGLVLAIIALGLMSAMNAHTPRYHSIISMALLGFGLGMSFPVMNVSVQSAVELRDLGIATAAINFFRSMGGSFGVALLGSVLLAQLGERIARIPGHEILGSHPALDLLRGKAQGVEGIATAVRALLMPALERSFAVVFLVACGIAVLTLVIAFFLKELPLRSTSAISSPEIEPD